MRAAFFEVLETLFVKDKNMFILTGDLGYKLFDNFKNSCSNRFYDVGVAESDMIGIASGLSLSGKNVYCYSIIPFLIMRTFEQIRMDVAYHNLNVKLIGVGGGVTYGFEGFTHFGLEDFTLMRALPNMTIVVPADRFEAQCLAKISHHYKGPMYIRLSYTGTSVVNNKMPEFEIGKPIFISEGKDIAIFAIGNMVYIGKQLVDILKKKGINATLINMHTLKPLNTNIIKQIASAHKTIFSLEEHYIAGGLGSAIAEVLAEKGYNGLFRRIGIEYLNTYIGNADYLRQQYGLSVEKIYDKIVKEIKGI